MILSILIQIRINIFILFNIEWYNYWILYSLDNNKKRLDHDQYNRRR